MQEKCTVTVCSKIVLYTNDIINRSNSDKQ